MTRLIPYLTFDGDCAEAMRFYAGALGGTLRAMTHRQSPQAADMPPDYLDRIMHAELHLPDGGLLYGADCPPHKPFQGRHGMAVSLNLDSVAAAAPLFGALADGGEITMAFGPTFWARGFGMVTDKFGVHWLVNAEMLGPG